MIFFSNADLFVDHRNKWPVTWGTQQHGRPQHHGATCLVVETSRLPHLKIRLAKEE